MTKDAFNLCFKNFKITEKIYCTKSFVVQNYWDKNLKIFVDLVKTPNLNFDLWTTSNDRLYRANRIFLFFCLIINLFHANVFSVATLSDARRFILSQQKHQIISHSIDDLRTIDDFNWKSSESMLLHFKERKHHYDCIECTLTHSHKCIDC